MTARKVLLICIAMVAASLGSSCSHHGEDPTIYVSQIKSVQKLVLAQMTISKMATIDDIKVEEAQGMKQVASALLANLKIGDRKGAYAYDTYLRAYVDLTNFSADDVAISNDGKDIEITLPRVQTEFDGRDMKIRELHYRVTGLRSKIGADERAKVKEMMNQSLVDEVQNNSAFTDELVAEAEHNAQTYFQNMFGSEKNVVVKFK